MVVGSFFCFLIWAIASNQYDGPELSEVELPPIDTPLSDLQFQFYDLLPQDGDSEQTDFHSPNGGATLLVPTDTTSSGTTADAADLGISNPIPNQPTKVDGSHSGETQTRSETNATSASIPSETNAKKASGQDGIRSANRDRLRPGYVIQVGSFKNRRTAEKLQATLLIEGYEGTHIADALGLDGNPIYRVLVGSYKTKRQAALVQRSLSNRGGTTPLLYEMNQRKQ